MYEAIRIGPVERPTLETQDKTSPPRADSDLPEYIVPPASTPPVVFREAPYTVLTMAPDGSWGVATSIFIRQAITEAMSELRGNVRSEAWMRVYVENHPRRLDTRRSVWKRKHSCREQDSSEC